MHGCRYERQALQRAQISGTPIRYIIIDLSPVTDIDASASHFINVRPCLLACLAL